MLNYKDLFYRSQARMAEYIEKIDELSASMKNFMCDMEENIMHQESITVHTKNKEIPLTKCSKKIGDDK